MDRQRCCGIFVHVESAGSRDHGVGWGRFSAAGRLQRGLRSFKLGVLGNLLLTVKS